MDLISRQAAIDAIMCEPTDAHYPSWYAERLEQLPSAHPGWIPVTERPIEGGQYIVTLKDDKEVWTDIAEWNPTFGGRWQAEFFDCEYRDIDNVVAWMSLPEAYKEHDDADHD